MNLSPIPLNRACADLLQVDLRLWREVGAHRRRG